MKRLIIFAAALSASLSAQTASVAPAGAWSNPPGLFNFQNAVPAADGYSWHAHGYSEPPNSSHYCSVKAGQPIDISSGVDIIENPDLTISGNLGAIRFVRTLHTMASTGGWSPFGYGGNHNYNLVLEGDNQSAQLYLPCGQAVGFAAQPNGTLINTVNAEWQGVVLTWGESPTLRFKDGTIFGFTGPIGLFGEQLSYIADPNGNTISISRNPSTPVLITAITDAVGRQLLFTYEAGGALNEGAIESISDPLGRVVNYTYNSAGYLATYTDANGGVWQYGYDNLGNLNSVTDPRGVVIEQNTFDNNGRVTSQIQADGNTIGIAYTLTNPTNGSSAVASAVVTDQLGRLWSYTFDDQGYWTQVTDPTGNARTFTRSSANLILAMTGPGTCPVYCGDPTQGDLTMTYDANGNLLTWSDSLADTYTYTYDPTFNHVLTAQDPVGNVTTYQYDSFGNLTAYIDPRGNKTTIARVENGLPVSITDPMSDTTTFEYDQDANLAVIVDPLREQTTLAYDPTSRLISITDPTGAQNFQEWDPLDRIIHQTDALGGVTSYSYDPVNNLLTLTDPRGGQSSFTYDNLSREITHTDPLHRSESFGYDPLSNLTSHTDRRGQTSTFGYDTINRLTSETYPDATVSRGYDAYSRLLQVVDSQGGTFGFTWDTAGRLTQTTAPQGTVSYVRDGDGRATWRQVTGQAKVTYQYDQSGNLTEATLGTTAIGMTYDSRNSLSTVGRSNGVSSAYSYDPLNRILTIAHQAGSTLLSGFSYSYDPAGNIASVSARPSQALTTAGASASFDAANEMTSRSGLTYTFDGNGNRLTQAGSSGTTLYTWDGRNRLASLTQANGTVSAFTYDFDRNLTQYANGSATTSYVLDDWTNAAAIYGGGSGVQSLLTGQSLDSHYATVSAGKAQFALTDALLSVAGNSGSSAALDGKSLYEPFGQTTSSGTSYPFAFTGRVPVAGGIYYYRNRYYDPLAGRFLSEDAVGFAAGDYNLYRYVGNGPITLTDPTGSDWLGGTVGVFFGVTVGSTLGGILTGPCPNAFVKGAGILGGALIGGAAGWYWGYNYIHVLPSPLPGPPGGNGSWGPHGFRSRHAQ